MFEPDHGYPERWSVVRWIEGAHPEVVDPDTSVDPRREDLAKDLASVLLAFSQAEVPARAIGNPHLRAYRGEPLATMDEDTRDNIERCRNLDDFAFDLDAAERVWADAMRLPGIAERATPRWYHGDLAAENLLMRDGGLTAVLDFGGLSLGDPTVDLIVAWEVLDPPARELFRRQVGVDDATWLRGRAWALSITLMIWYYWTTLPEDEPGAWPWAATSWPTRATRCDSVTTPALLMCGPGMTCINLPVFGRFAHAQVHVRAWVRGLWSARVCGDVVGLDTLRIREPRSTKS